MSDIILTEIDERGVATVTLNRPDRHNAFNEEVIARLTETFGVIEADPRTRVMVLTGAGKSFSAGADLNWMRKFIDYSVAENIADARKLAAMLDTLNSLALPTIACVNGPAYGGGVGLVACCDIAIATEPALFALTEVRLGLTPATISPYVVAAIGARQARRYFLTAERFDAYAAQAMGLVHEVVPDADEMAVMREQLVDAILKNGPGAVSAAKELVFAVNGRPIDEALQDDTARRIAERRTSEEGQEGLAAFFEKRKPKWIKS
ncbi:MAG: enoyl-CoA hydratase/isomerase family protein [Alphaproteobacteria bacterium]|nr:MAG: enoyl-CoA hydratase/isomerase family protein [Alphaproteobacteria bacterium]